MSVYCCSDLHGCYHLWKQIQAFLKPKDKLFFLGDAIDRQPHGLTILKEMMNDSRVTCLLGNHEDILFGAAGGYEENPKTVELFINDWLLNGGQETAEIWTKFKKKSQDEILDYIFDMDTLIPYRNEQNQLIYLSHAGFTPNQNWTSKDWTELSDSWKIFWDREHVDDPWPAGFDNVYIVHGHTPVPYLTGSMPKTQKEFQIYNYCDNHKVDIDLMSFESGVAALLNLDTWMVTYFYDSAIDRD